MCFPQHSKKLSGFIYISFEFHGRHCNQETLNGKRYTKIETELKTVIILICSHIIRYTYLCKRDLTFFSYKSYKNFTYILNQYPLLW